MGAGTKKKSARDDDRNFYATKRNNPELRWGKRRNGS